MDKYLSHINERIRTGKQVFSHWPEKQGAHLYFLGGFARSAWPDCD
jgi:hypothetical protein